MAVIEFEGVDALADMFKDLAKVPDDVLKEAVGAMAEEGKRAVRSTGAAMGVRDPESRVHILDKITATKPKTTADGAVSRVTFSGTRRRGNTDTRNAEIAFVNEYGKSGQQARPFIRQAAEQYADQIAEPGARIIGDWFEKTATK